MTAHAHQYRAIPVSLRPTVAIPAKNEAARLPRLIAALDRQTGCGAFPLRVTVLVNNSSDRSEAMLRRLAGQFRNLDLAVAVVTFPDVDACVGRARKRALDAALARMEEPWESVLLTTDADAEPRHDWVATNVAAIASGAHVVTGIIVPDAAEEMLLGPGVVERRRNFDDYAMLRDRLSSLIDPIAHDPWPRHPFEMAGSLAVRGDAYLALGGMDTLAYREDLAFVSKARACGYRVRHDPDAFVTVSARTTGRVVQGMAASLDAWRRDAAENRPLMVEDPVATIARFRRRRDLRAKAGNVATSGGPFGWMPAEWLIETLEPDDPDASDVPVQDAMAALRHAVAGFCDTPATAELP